MQIKSVLYIYLIIINCKPRENQVRFEQQKGLYDIAMNWKMDDPMNIRMDMK